MNELFAKLSSYNLFNNLLPGALFCAAAAHLGLFTVDATNVVSMLVAYYVVGLIVGRIGSVLVEPVILRLGWIQYAPYSAFVRASKSDDKLDVLVETNNTYRALLSTAVCLLVSLALVYLRRLFPENLVLDQSVMITGLAILFFFAYRKQTSFIRRRVEADTQQAPQPGVADGTP